MAKRAFSRAERWAVYQTHDAHCYICKQPISFTEMHVDHVVPERLLNDGAVLRSVLEALGLPPNFAINDFSNWLPACLPCNLAKGSTPFDPAPIILIQFRRAKERAEKARALAESLQTDRAVDQAIVAVEAAADRHALDLRRLQPLLQIFVERHPEAMRAMLEQIERAKRGLSFSIPEPVLELRLTPFARVVYSEGRAEIFPAAPTPRLTTACEPDPCPRCGSLGPFSGIRCLTCGFLDPGD
jgi:5-methylcytosine-specific restriction endonuclease McrA